MSDDKFDFPSRLQAEVVYLMGERCKTYILLADFSWNNYLKFDVYSYQNTRLKFLNAILSCQHNNTSHLILVGHTSDQTQIQFMVIK